MARRLPKDVDWTEVTLEVEDRWCGKCGRRMHICSFRRHRIEVDPIVWTKNKRSFATVLPVFLTGNFGLLLSLPPVRGICFLAG